MLPTKREMQVAALSPITVEDVPKAYNYEPRWAATVAAAMVAAKEYAKYGVVSLGTLYRMSKTFLPAAIFAARTNDCADFSMYSTSRHVPGWTPGMRDKRRTPTRRDEKRMQEIADFFMGGGTDFWENGFEGFIRAIVPQSMTWDRYTYEVVRNEDRMPVSLVPVDATSVAKAMPTGKNLNGRWNPRGDEVAFLQVVDNKVTAEFKRGELGWGARNPSTLLNGLGHGVPEMETGMNILVDILNIYIANSARASTGLRSDALVIVKSDMATGKFNTFERKVVAAMSNNSGRQATPVLQIDPNLKEDVTVVPLHHPSSEMELGAQMGMLVKYFCALFDMDPARIQQVFGVEGQTSTVESGKGLSSRILSGHRSAYPMLRNIAWNLTTTVLWHTPGWEDYVFEFTGLTDETREERVKIAAMEADSYKSVNEVRQEMDEQAWDDPISRRPLHAAYAPLTQAVIANAVSPEDNLATDASLGVGEWLQGKQATKR